MNELNQYIVSGGIGLIVILFGALVWFVQRLIKTLDRIDARVYQIDTTLATSETRLKTAEGSIEVIVNRVDDIDSRFLVLETEHRLCPRCNHR